MKSAVASYHARMQRVLRHIDEHLDDDLSVDVLSGVAAFSRYHFQRQFSLLFGVSPHRYVQLVRLKRASSRLAFRTGDSILQIALDSGYEGPEAFARAFRQRLDQTPSAFRDEPHWGPWHAACAPLSFTDADIRIVDFPALAVATLQHRGDPARVGDTVQRFIAWRRTNGLSPTRSATFNILHADPDTVPPDKYCVDLCAATDKEIAPNDAEVVGGMIPPGPCAVLRLVGSSDNLRPAVHYLYADWLPRSGRELRDAPIFAQRVRFFPDVPEHEAVTDIFLPLR